MVFECGNGSVVEMITKPQHTLKGFQETTNHLTETSGSDVGFHGHLTWEGGKGVSSAESEKLGDIWQAMNLLMGFHSLQSFGLGGFNKKLLGVPPTRPDPRVDQDENSLAHIGKVFTDGLESRTFKYNHIAVRKGPYGKSRIGFEFRGAPNLEVLNRYLASATELLETGRWRRMATPKFEISWDALANGVMARVKELEKSGGLKVGGAPVNTSFITKELLITMLDRASLPITSSVKDRSRLSQEVGIPFSLAWGEQRFLKPDEKQRVTAATNSFADEVIRQAVRLHELGGKSLPAAGDWAWTDFARSVDGGLNTWVMSAGLAKPMERMLGMKVL
jgi:hypothetical protein